MRVGERPDESARGSAEEFKPRENARPTQLLIWIFELHLLCMSAWIPLRAKSDVNFLTGIDNC